MEGLWFIIMIAEGILFYFFDKWRDRKAMLDAVLEQHLENSKIKHGDELQRF